MIVKRICILLSCMSVLSVSATTTEVKSTPQREGERVRAKAQQHGGWADHQVNTTIVDQLRTHDDIVGVRNDGGNVVNGDFRVPSPVTTNPRNTTANIDCNHPSYKKLCAELAELSGNKPTPKPTPKPKPKPKPKPYYWKTLVSSSKLNYSASLPSSAKKLRFTVNGQYREVSLPNTLYIPYSDTDSDYRGGRRDCHASATVTGGLSIRPNSVIFAGGQRRESNKNCNAIAKVELSSLAVYTQ